MKKIIFTLLFLSSHLFAQDDQFQKQVEEIMHAREEMLKSLMDDSSGGDMEKRMLEMMKKFQGPGFGDVDFGDLGGDTVGEYDWITNDTHKILKIKVKQVKDHPLDIKIEKGSILMKGDVESVSQNGKNKNVKRVHFERSFSLPQDVDQTSPEFENKDGEVLIKFKRLAGTRPNVSPPVKVRKNHENERKPITPETDDLSI